MSLAARGSPDRAAHERRYLKSDLEFLGATVPMLRQHAKAFVRAHPELTRRDLRRLARQAWQARVHELRSVVIGILEQRIDLLEPGDARFLIGLVRASDTWAHVDWLATKVIGALLVRQPELAGELDRWATHDCFWVRRAALLALHDALLAGEGDFDHFARLAVPMLGEREFFIRKAIGWVLRSAAKRRPERTIGFVSRHASELSALSFREAVRVLPAAQQARLRELREASTGARTTARSIGREQDRRSRT